MSTSSRGRQECLPHRASGLDKLPMAQWQGLISSSLHGFVLVERCHEFVRCQLNLLEEFDLFLRCVTGGQCTDAKLQSVESSPHGVTRLAKLILDHLLDFHDRETLSLFPRMASYVVANSLGWSIILRQTASDVIGCRALICRSASWMAPSCARWVVKTSGTDL